MTKKNNYLKLVLLLLGVFILSLFSACAPKKESPQPTTSPKATTTPAKVDKTTINIVVSILPQVEFVKKVGQEKVNVTVMVPPGANPHTYEPKPDQLQKLSTAHLYAKVGSGVEFELAWMDKLLQLNKKMEVVDLSKSIEIIEKDPHIWLSPANAKQMTENFYQSLIKIDPANKDFYTKNKDAYLKELDELDSDIKKKLSLLKMRKFMVYHPAWIYFAKRYNLTEIGVEKEGKEPSAKAMIDLVKQANQEGIKVIFISPQFSSDKAKTIAREFKGQVVTVNDLSEDYVKNMQTVTDLLVKGSN